MRTLVGVGVGPGDPELVTLKAVRVLRDADVVLVPVLGDDVPGRAERVVRAYADSPRVRRVVFALNDPGGVTARRQRQWDGAADGVLTAFEAGAETVAFATIGDPAVYSTFSYLAQTVRDADPSVAVEMVPGITAMQALAAGAGVALCEGTESVSLVPATAGPQRLRAALSSGDTVVAYKCGRVLGEVVAEVEAAGRVSGAIYGAHLGLPDEDVRALSDVDSNKAPYLATVLVPAHRTGRGGAL